VDDVEVTVTGYGRRFNDGLMQVDDPLSDKMLRKLDAAGGAYWAAVHRTDTPTPVGVFVSGATNLVRLQFCRPGGDLDHELVYHRCADEPARMRLMTVAIWRGGMRHGDRADSWNVIDGGTGVRRVGSRAGSQEAPVDGLDPHAFDEDWPQLGDYARLTRPGRPLWSFGQPPFAQVVAESGSLLLHPDQAAGRGERADR
jgi:hypothetical protein